MSQERLGFADSRQYGAKHHRKCGGPKLVRQPHFKEVGLNPNHGHGLKKPSQKAVGPRLAHSLVVEKIKKFHKSSDLNSPRHQAREVSWQLVT